MQYLKSIPQFGRDPIQKWLLNEIELLLMQWEGKPLKHAHAGVSIKDDVADANCTDNDQKIIFTPSLLS